jgi:hypothetical protein
MCDDVANRAEKLPFTDPDIGVLQLTSGANPEPKAAVQRQRNPAFHAICRAISRPGRPPRPRRSAWRAATSPDLGDPNRHLRRPPHRVQSGLHPGGVVYLSPDAQAGDLRTKRRGYAAGRLAP